MLPHVFTSHVAPISDIADEFSGKVSIGDMRRSFVQIFGRFGVDKAVVIRDVSVKHAVGLS